MAKKPGLRAKYIKMAKRAGASAKTLFKKAWSLQRKAGKTTSSKVLKGARKTSIKKGVRTMSTKKGNPRRIGLLSQTTINALTTGTLIAVPALGGIWIINQIPWVKDQKAWIKAAIQAGFGITGLTLLKGAMAKKLSSGVIAGGMMQLVFPYLPGLKFGAGRRLTPAELASLQTGKGQRFGKTTSWPGQNRTGKPVDIISGRGRFANR